jgi:hypothetical protein
MKLLIRPAIAALLVVAGVALMGCPEKPPKPRTVASAPTVAPAPATTAPAVPQVALPNFTHLVYRIATNLVG